MQRSEPVISPALRIASVAVLAAVTTVFTVFIRVPSPARGYFNLGDVAVAFTAFTFGPISAFIAGGIGTALADLIGSYVQWAPISLVVHGLEGLVIGLIARARPGSVSVCIAAGVAGVIVMAAGYFAGGLALTGMGPSLAEAPGNVVQAAAGIVLGLPLSIAVAKAYPPVRRYSW
jgi:uncharacterized membrane protein